MSVEFITQHTERPGHRDPHAHAAPQPFTYPLQRPYVEPDWTRLPGYRHVTKEQWESAQWQRAHRGIPLDLVDCPHRRIDRAAGELAAKEACQPGSHVTVLLPRRSTRPLLGRLLHDRTADKIAGAVSRIPRSAAMIIPFDVTARVEVLHEYQASPNGNAKPAQAGPASGDHHRAAGPPGVIPISALASYPGPPWPAACTPSNTGRWKAAPSWPA